MADDKIIDVEAILRKRNPSLLKTLPKFVINYLKRIAHQDTINEMVTNNKDLHGLPFVEKGLNTLGMIYDAVDLENIPTTGRFIFASNHPLGGLDGLVIINSVGKRFPDVKFVVNDLLMNVPNLEPLFLPVNKFGRQNSDYARKLDASYASSCQILYFPAGLCSRKIKGKITDLKWQKSFVMKATQYQRDVIPVFFEGRNSNFFYNFANIRKMLGIKMNYEMVYLVDEMFKQRGRKLRLIFGKPIPYTTFDSSKTPNEWAQFVREQVYSLKK